MKSEPMRVARNSAGTVMARRDDHARSPRCVEAEIEQRRVHALHCADEPDILVRAGAFRPQQQARRRRAPALSASTSEARDGGHDGRRQRLVHAALDAGHPKERQKDRDHDERGERDRAADLDRPRASAMSLCGRSRGGAGEPVHDVLGHDDRGVDQQARRR